MSDMGADTVATNESQERMARRRSQRWREAWYASPEYQAHRWDWERYRRYKRKHPWSGVPWLILKWLCRCWGMTLGGRPPKGRRCTKRLGSRFCWGWRVAGTDRCGRHPRARVARPSVAREPGADRCARHPRARDAPPPDAREPGVQLT